MKLRVLAVVPALDEAEHIAEVMRSMPAFVTHIVLVDDGSRDDTAAIALAADARCEVVSHARPRGVGAAIARGYERARELDVDAAVVLAGDAQMDPRDLSALLAPIAEGRSDYVKGCRFAWPGGLVAFPTSRLVGGVVFSTLTRLATGLDVDDTQCGYTAISRRALDAIEWSDAWPGYGYPNDLLLRCARLGLRVAEVPVRPVYAGEASGLRARHLPRIVGHLLRAIVARATTRGAGALARLTRQR